MKKTTMKGMMIRRAFCSAMALAMVFSSLVLPQGAITAYAEDEESTLTAQVGSSTYSATQIANGNFESTTPWESYVLNGVTYTSKPTPYPSGTITAAIPNGVGEGWNTTENSPYQGSLFEVWDIQALPADKTRPFPDANGRYFIEMNANQPAALYQDLPTQGGDVIRWTLQHAARNGDGSDVQSMYVTIGAPATGTNGAILAASGVNDSIDPKIQDGGKAIYSSGGVTAASGNAGCASEGSLIGLSVNKSDTTWHDVAGIYVVPAGQDVTRFAFCAGAVGSSGGDSKKLSCGNFLDNITFSTLFGNLKATKQENGDVQISGYWGDSNPNKKLVVEFNEDNKKDIDMSGVCNSNFIIDIPQSVIGDSTNVKVYHQDYDTDTAKTTVKVTHAHSWNYVSGTGSDANKIYAYCSASGGSDCSYQGEENKTVSMTLTAADATYNGTAYSGARVSSWSKSDDALATKPEITYYCLNGEGEEETETNESNSGAASLGAAPKNVGRYRAKIQIGEATATADFSINKLGINSVSFTEPTTTSGNNVPQTLGIAENAYYGGSISWNPSDSTFAYNRQYTATVTLDINNNNCGFVALNAITVPSGWTKKSVSETTLILEKKYTIKPKITSVTVPTDMQLSELTTKEDQLAALPAYVPVEVEDNSVTGMAITWVLKKNTAYSNALSAENTFTWTIQESEYKNKYDTNGKTLKGEIKIKNPSHTTHSWIYEGQEKQLSAYCALSSEPGCIYDNEHKLTLTLSASDMTYTGNAYTGASISEEGKSAWTAAGLPIPTIQYEGDSDTTYTLSDTAPTAAGNYKAVLAVGEQRAEAAFQITSSGSGSGGDDPGSGGESGGGSGSGSGGESGGGSGSESGSGSGGSGSGSGSGSGTGSGGSSGGGSGSGGSSGGGSGSGGSSGGSSGGGSTPSTPSEPTDPTENFTIPVKNEQTVKVEAEIKQGTANVSEITNETIDKVVNNKDSESKIDTITIDLSGAKQEITGVTLSKESVKTLAETTAEADNGIDTATIQLSKATVVLDNKTLETLVEQAKGTDIRLVVEDKDRKELNTVQQTSLSQHQVATTFEAYFVSEGQRIHDFKGGTAVVSIDFTPEAGKDPSFYHLVYVAENGEMTRYKTKYNTGKLMFTATHFSDYAVIYDTGEKNETVKPEEEEKTDSTDTDAKDDSSDTDAKATMDTSYSKLRLRVPTSTKTTNVLKWTKQTGADGYVIYGAPCDTKKQTYTVKELVTIENGSTTTWTHKKLKKATYYKYYIKAYKLENGKKVWLAKSKVVHSTTTGGKYGNAKAMKVNKTAVSLAEGKTFTIKAEQVIKDKPIAWHQNIKYESSNTEVTSVTGKGVIKAKKTGTCYIYVYAQNGMYQRIKVTVS